MKLSRLRAFLLVVVSAGSISSGGAWGAQEPFTFQSQFSAASPAATRGFGSRIDLSADGSTALVTDFQTDCGAVPPCGAKAFIFVRNSAGWMQQAELAAPDGQPWKLTLVTALSRDGNTALLGVTNADCDAGLDCGIAYAFARQGTAWTLQQTLVAHDTTALDHFGGKLALSRDGNRALIGAIGAFCPPSLRCGAVYAFTRSGGVWTEGQKIAGDPDTGVYFGHDVALSADGRTAAIVEGFDEGSFVGEVLIFTRSGETWSLQSRIPRPDGVVEFANEVSAFSADGSLLLVRGAAGPFAGGGSVFVFVWTGSVWAQEAVLAGASGSEDFGRSPVLTDDGEIAVIPSRPVGCLDSPDCGGVGEVFKRNGGAWDPIQSLVPPGLGTAYVLGPAAISGDGSVALLGVPSTPCAAGSGCGTVYSFATAALAAGIPTLDGRGLALLASVLILSALVLLRRRRLSGGPAR